jgi:hypothetical protein
MKGKKNFLYIINETPKIKSFLKNPVQAYKYRKIIINKNNYYHISVHSFNIFSFFFVFNDTQLEMT